MIDSGRVKSFISHEDPETASLAIKYFAEAWSDDPDILSLALDAYAKSNESEIFSLDNLQVSQEALAKALKILPSVRDPFQLAKLRGVVCMASPALLEANLPLIEKANYLPSEIHHRIAKKIKMGRLSAEELWDRLVKYAKDMRNASFFGEINTGYITDAVELLGKSKAPADSFILEELENIVADEDGVFEMILIKLAGARKLAAAIPLLLIRLTLDAPMTPLWASDALARIGSMGAVPMIKEAYLEDGGEFNLECVRALECLRGDLAEDSLLELARREKDKCNRTWICGALCHHISEKGVEIVREEIKKGHDVTVTDLEAELLAVCNILGIILPEEEALKAEAKTSKERRKAALRENYANLDDQSFDGLAF